MGVDDMSDASEQKIDELLSLMRSAVPDPEGMNDAGRIGFVYKYDYDPTETYEKLDVVLFGPSLWTPKQNTTGNAPPDQSQPGQENVKENEFWKIYLPGALGADYVKKTDIASAPTETEPGTPGISMPDGKTITIDETGLLKGAPPGKQLTQEQMNEQIAAGELADGDVVYLTGPAAGENGLLVKVDKELNAESVNPVRNSVITQEIEQLKSLIKEARELKATLETFGLCRISESSAVTEADSGLVLSAKEKNASSEGTLANQINSFDYIKRTVQRPPGNWDGTSENAKIMFYKNSETNWCGMGVDGGGSLHIRVGVGTQYIWTFTVDGHLKKNGTVVI